MYTRRFHSFHIQDSHQDPLTTPEQNCPHQDLEPSKHGDGNNDPYLKISELEKKLKNQKEALEKLEKENKLLKKALAEHGVVQSKEEKCSSTVTRQQVI